MRTRLPVEETSVAHLDVRSVAGSRLAADTLPVVSSPIPAFSTSSAGTSGGSRRRDCTFDLSEIASVRFKTVAHITIGRYPRWLGHLNEMRDSRGTRSLHRTNRLELCTANVAREGSSARSRSKDVICSHLSNYRGFDCGFWHSGRRTGDKRRGWAKDFGGVFSELICLIQNRIYATRSEQNLAQSGDDGKESWKSIQFLGLGNTGYYAAKLWIPREEVSPEKRNCRGWSCALVDFRSLMAGQIHRGCDWGLGASSKGVIFFYLSNCYDCTDLVEKLVLLILKPWRSSLPR